MSEIITAAITGCVTLLGVLLSNRAAQAVTDEKLTETHENDKAGFYLVSLIVSGVRTETEAE